MNAVFNFLENKLMPPLNRLANLRVVQAIMQAGIVTVPFTIVGSIFLIINNLPDIIPPLAPFFEQTILKLSPLYSIVTTMSIDSIAIFYALATAFYLTESYRKESEKQMSSFVGAILGLFAFY
ncbi:PTS system cellobiose-specific IIC component [Tetragenococcus muriaticus 3MR10-3]|uniref:PTS system cellobiose-specific IIC component n=1 Tax=Tetragenococcus muriaticus 3MR10-3 TaxID=1302648 RepID=A0A091CDH3_9ENTE|nr:PTS system cellobiose-specific IIC component [Tetragenococcus muriaticus 3MR10-3]